VASDMALFGQAGPKHGSAPVGGSTDFLPLYVGAERAMQSATLCEMWSAHEALQLGLVTQIVPVTKVDGRFVPNPLVVTDRWLDEAGRPCLGKPRTGAAREEGKQLLARAETDLSLLDAEVEALCAKLLMTMPDCLTVTLEQLRKHKLAHWDRNRESNRAWLALNMNTEAKAGFRAYNEGPKGNREVDFAALRRLIAQGHSWDDELIAEIFPKPGPETKR
jgi:6-oxo-cyclohex-1-ene-carbonyl-CoA hydrolase